MPVSASWLTKHEWALLHKQIRPPVQPLDDFAETVCCGDNDGLSRNYKKPDIEKIVSALREILQVRGKFSAKFAFDSQLKSQGASKKSGSLSAMTKDQMCKIIQQFVTKDLDSIGGGGGGGDQDEHNFDYDESSNNSNAAHLVNEETAAAKKKESGNRRGRSPVSQVVGPSNKNNTGKNNLQQLQIVPSQEDSMEGDLFSAPRKNENKSNGATSSGAVPRLSRGTTTSTTVTAAGTNKEKESPAKRRKAATTKHDDDDDGGHEEDNDHDNSQDVPPKNSSVGGITNNISNDDDAHRRKVSPSKSSNNHHSKNNGSKIMSNANEGADASSALNNNNNSNSGDSNSNSSSKHQAGGNNSAPAAAIVAPVVVVDDTSTLLGPITNSLAIAKIFQDYPRLIPPGVTSTNIGALAAGIGLMPATDPYRSPLMDIKHNVFRCTVTYGTSQPLKFKLATPLVYSASTGDRVALIALRAPFHNKRGERITNSLEPEHWPIPPNQVLKLEVDGNKTSTTYKKNWPTSRRSDISADTPIRRSYLIVDVTDSLSSSVTGGQHSFRYEMLERNFTFDIGVFVIKRLPSALIVTDFLKKLQTNAAKMQEQRGYLRRFYSQALGLNRKAHDEDDDDDDELEAGAPTMTLRCPITYSTISVPIRGRHCDHVQCVDFAAHIESCHTTCFWTCPVCDKPMGLEDVVWDPLVHRLLNRCNASGRGGNAFDSGAATFALRVAQDLANNNINNSNGAQAGEIIIGGVPAMFENLSSPSSSTRVSGNNVLPGGGNGQSIVDSQQQQQQLHKKKAQEQVSLADCDQEQPNRVASKGNNFNGNQVLNYDDAYKRAVEASLAEHHRERSEMTQKLIRRQDSQLIRTNSMASFVVKGNSKTDAIELD